MQEQLREPIIVVRGSVPDQMVAYARSKLLAVVAPTRTRAAAGRHLPLASRTGKRPDVDLGASGLMRLVRDPMAVGRKQRQPFDVAAIEERIGLSTASDGQHPDILGSRSRADIGQDEPAVAGPTGGGVESRQAWGPFRDEFLGASAVGGLRVQASSSVSCCGEGYPGAVGRPEGKLFCR